MTHNQFKPGDRLTIRGYAGNVLETEVTCHHAYQIQGARYVAYVRADGTTAAVDARRVERARPC